MQADNLQELNSQMDAIQERAGETPQQNDGQMAVELPKLEGNSGCADAVRLALGAPWGRREPRTMAELQHIFQLNALFFSSGTLSGVLTHLTRTGQVRRMEKTGRWAYTLTG